MGYAEQIFNKLRGGGRFGSANRKVDTVEQLARRIMLLPQRRFHLPYHAGRRPLCDAGSRASLVDLKPAAVRAAGAFGRKRIGESFPQVCTLAVKLAMSRRDALTIVEGIISPGNIFKLPLAQAITFRQVPI